MEPENFAKVSQAIEMSKSAIMDASKLISGRDMDARYNELMLAPIMASMMRHGAVVRSGSDADSVDVGFSQSPPPALLDAVQKWGPTIAEVYHSDWDGPHKNQLVEIGATILISCRMILDKIVTDLTSRDERQTLTVAAAHLVGDTMLSILDHTQKSERDEVPKSLS
jgi:hypothetical protein